MEQAQNGNQTDTAAVNSPAERHERFKAVVLPHLGDAARLARMFTSNRADAEDVLQEATVRLLRFIGTYRGGDARSFVLRVTRNAAFTWLRRNRRPNHIPLQSSEELDVHLGSESPQDAHDPFAIESRRAESEALRKAISRLPGEQREIVVLRDLNGLAYAEIAAALRIPLGTVMSRLSRTHAALRLQVGRRADTWE
jgi:RNA polymerase sigma factor (sigma-70 family)